MSERPWREIAACKMPVYLPCLLLAALVSCATRYQPSSGSVTGGYSEEYLGGDVFDVHFTGNGFTSRSDVERGVMLRSAQIALEHGFPYFGFLQGTTDRSTSFHATPPTKYSYGVLYAVSKYGASARIRLACFPNDGPGTLYDVAKVVRSYGAQHGLSAPAHIVPSERCRMLSEQQAAATKQSVQDRNEMVSRFCGRECTALRAICARQCQEERNHVRAWQVAGCDKLCEDLQVRCILECGSRGGATLEEMGFLEIPGSQSADEDAAPDHDVVIVVRNVDSRRVIIECGNGQRYLVTHDSGCVGVKDASPATPLYMVPPGPPESGSVIMAYEDGSRCRVDEAVAVPTAASYGAPDGSGPNCHGGHYIKRFDPANRFVELADGSLWQVAASHAIVFYDWSAGMVVTACGGVMALSTEENDEYEGLREAPVVRVN